MLSGDSDSDEIYVCPGCDQVRNHQFLILKYTNSHIFQY